LCIFNWRYIICNIFNIFPYSVARFELKSDPILINKKYECRNGNTIKSFKINGDFYPLSTLGEVPHFFTHSLQELSSSRQFNFSLLRLYHSIHQSPCPLPRENHVLARGGEKIITQLILKKNNIDYDEEPNGIDLSVLFCFPSLCCSSEVCVTRF
jgi:hypothetical protein